MQAHGDVTTPVVNMLIGGIVKVVVNYILVAIPSLNIIGAAIGTIVCYVTITALDLIAMRRTVTTHPAVARNLIRPAAAAAIMGAATFFAEAVLRRLPRADKAVIRAGLFPATAAGLENERFALVSLDADLEESTLAGLRWFVPRMEQGGYLLLHDWNHPGLPGVREALARYEAETGQHLAGVPLCDITGTLVIPF